MPDPRNNAAVAGPHDVFDRYGLGPTGFWGSLALPLPPGQVRPAPVRLRESFEQLGGLYGAFAQFLSFRADLLGAAYLAELRQVRVAAPALSRDVFIDKLKAALPPDVAEALTRGLDADPVWATLHRTAWRSWHKGQRVVLQAANPAVTDAEISAFTAGIARLGHKDLARATAPEVIAQFTDWLRQSESLAQERSYLAVLARFRGETLAEYPALLEDLTTADLLAWPWVEAEPAARLLRNGASDVVTKIAAAVLEQYCSLAIIDAALDLDQIGVTRAGRIVMHRVSRAMAVPPPQVNTGMKYIAAVLLGESAAMVQTLVPLATGQPAPDREKELMNLLSGIEPELKVHLWFPRAAAAFESNWMALAKLLRKRPLYLDSLHRNLEAVGYWNAAAVAAGGPMTDALAEAHAQVVERVLRTQVGLLLNRRAVTEWSTGAGLLAFGAMREMNRVAEEIRDNNLTMGVDIRESAASGAGDAGSGSRQVRLGVLIAVLLVALLISLRWGAAAGAGAAQAAKVVAIATAAGLFWLVAKLG